jgi:hypothetical protein
MGVQAVIWNVLPVLVTKVWMIIALSSRVTLVYNCRANDLIGPAHFQVHLYPRFTCLACRARHCLGVAKINELMP